MDNESLRGALEGVRQTIRESCSRSGRDMSDIKLLAVSKKQPLEKLVAYQEVANDFSMQVYFGENYVQEWKKKKQQLMGNYFSHLIGPLQRNKVRKAISLFDVIESVHSLELLKVIQHEAERGGVVQRIFLQVNISDDQAKSGFDPAAVLNVLKDEVGALKNIHVEGLMTITRYYPVKEEVRDDFKKFYDLSRKAKELVPTCTEVSMGMSSDFDIALEEGATVIRVGTALFGERAV